MYHRVRVVDPEISLQWRSLTERIGKSDFISGTRGWGVRGRIVGCDKWGIVILPCSRVPREGTLPGR